jgi:mRNA interferase HigB
LPHLPIVVPIDRQEQFKKFWNRPGCGDARGPLHSWYDEADKATWTSPQEIKVQYASASICGNNRVVFNIGGNKYRLVVEMQYPPASELLSPE